MPDFTWTPSRGVTRTPRYLVKEAKFGEGYIQSTRDGISNVLMDYTLSFNDRSDTEIKAIMDFIDSKGGTDTFTFLPPAPWAADGEITVVCKQAPTQINSIDQNSVTLTFEQRRTP